MTRRFNVAYVAVDAFVAPIWIASTSDPSDGRCYRAIRSFDAVPAPRRALARSSEADGRGLTMSTRTFSSSDSSLAARSAQRGAARVRRSIVTTLVLTATMLSLAARRAVRPRRPAPSKPEWDGALLLFFLGGRIRRLAWFARCRGRRYDRRNGYGRLWVSRKLGRGHCWKTGSCRHVASPFFGACIRRRSECGFGPENRYSSGSPSQ